MAARNLNEVKVVAAQYQKYLTENSLIRDVFDPEIFSRDAPSLAG